MKKIIKSIFSLLIFIPMIINARINYEDSVQYANNYIYSFEEYNDYIYLSDSVPFLYEKSGSKVDNNFKSGGFLSRVEYEISNVKGNSYLSNGLQYWTLTKSSHLKHYIVDYKLVEQFDDQPSGVKVTEFIKPDVSVSGTGSYGDPWTFDKVLSINIYTDNKLKGKVSNVDCSNETMRKEGIYVNVVENGKSSFYTCPEAGYRYLNNSCNKYITNFVSSDRHEVSNLDKDSLVCKIYFSYITKPITVKGCTNCDTGKTDRTIYVNNTHKIWLKDSDGTTKITSIDNLPSKTGHTFKGYYLETTFETQIIDVNGKLNYNDQLASKNILYPRIEANQYTLTFNANGGNSLTPSSKTVTYDKQYGELASVKREGYKFLGWYTAKTGGTKITSTTTVKITESQTLFARWEICPAGTYGSDGLTCTSCLAGTYNSNTGSTSSTACVQCAAGKYSGPGASSCTNCSKGYYASGTGNAECTICPVGTYADATGKSSCTSCAAGTYNPNTGSTSSTACEKCAAGKYSAAKASSCTNCSKGYYASGTGNTTCTICPVGTYADATGKSSCTSCPAGTANPNTGSTSSSACVQCSKGYYASGTGNTTCTKCAAGTYADATGKSSCTACPSGYTSPEGSDDANDCYVATSLPTFTYTGSYELVTDSDTIIASGNNVAPTIPNEYKTYTGNWKLRLLSDGNLTINSLPNSSNIDIYLVGGGQGGTKGSKEVTSGTMYTTGSGGKGGYRKTYKTVSITFGTSYSVDIGVGGESSAKSGGDSTITIGSTTYKASSGERSNTGAEGGYEFDSSSYSKKYGGGGGSGCSVWSYSAYRCSGGSGKDGGGNSGSSGWSPNATGRVCKDDKGIVSAGGNGKANTGGGGGGGGAGCGSYILDGGKGGSGIVIIRNAR